MVEIHRPGVDSAPGAISHYCVVTPEGITVANVFEDEDGLRAHYGRAEFRQALERAGVPRFTPEVRPVHTWRHAPVAAAVK
jgi:hypothetical protein